MKKIIIIAMAICFIFTLTTNTFADGKRPAKNIIFMVPDGMGISYVTAARIFKNGPDGDVLALENFPQIGYQRTHSANSTVTDSAAAASTWASGAKYNNGEISCHDDDFDGDCDSTPVPTVLDIAKSMGKSTGLVATSDITHATPAAFGANVHNRKCEFTIAQQYLDREIDVLLGGGIANNRSSCKLSHTIDADITNLLIEYADAGYAVVDNESDMNDAVSAGADKLLGLFKSGGKTPESFWVYPSDTYPEGEPTLAEMTAAALDILEDEKKGFFLLIEGSQIDWAGHENSIDYLLADMLGFDAAVEVVQDWVAAKKKRMKNTLIAIVADHETGGMMINGPYGTLSEAGEKIEDEWTSGGHTAQDTIIWSQGPGSKYLGKALDNTDLYYIMKNALKGKNDDDDDD
jgi:alkaline phosphatase